MNLDKITHEVIYVKELKDWTKTMKVSVDGISTDKLPFSINVNSNKLISRINHAILDEMDKIIVEEGKRVREFIANEVIGEKATEGMKEVVQTVQGTGIKSDDNEKEPPARLDPVDELLENAAKSMEQNIQPKVTEVNLNEDGQREGEHPEPIDEMENELKHSAPEHDSKYDEQDTEVMKVIVSYSNSRELPCYPEIMDEPVLNIVKTNEVHLISDNLKHLVNQKRRKAFKIRFNSLFPGREGMTVTIYDVCKLVKEHQ